MLVLALPSSAEAQSVHLRFSAPVGSMCPNGPTLSADVEQLTGQRFVADPEQAEVRVVGRIERADLGLRAQLEAHTADGTPLGTRELRAETADDCASLRRPLAMVLALLLEQPVLQRRRFPLALGPELAGNTHVMPRTAGGVGLLAWLEPAPWLGLRFSAEYWWPVIAETRSGSGARMQGAGAALAFCPRLLGGARVVFWQCLGVHGGALRAQPRGLTSDRPKQLVFLDLLSELVLSVRLARGTALWAASGPLFALTRPELYFEHADGAPVTVHRARPVGAIFRLALTIGGR